MNYNDFLLVITIQFIVTNLLMGVFTAMIIKEFRNLKK